MGRRDSILDDISRLPWPVGIMLAAACYASSIMTLHFWADDPYLRPIAVAWSITWPLFAVLFILTSVVSVVRRRRRRQLFEANKSVESIKSLSWQEFEQYIAGYFQSQGYSVIETPEGPDGGIDLVLRKKGEKAYVQCKHWKAYRVGVDKVREHFAVMVSGGADQGFLVTSGTFTRPAREFAKAHDVQLIDGQELVARHPQSEPRTQTQKTARSEALPPMCPACQTAMVKRIAKKGPSAGSAFWGCTNFPKCRYTLDHQETRE